MNGMNHQKGSTPGCGMMQVSMWRNGRGASGTSCAKVWHFCELRSAKEIQSRCHVHVCQTGSATRKWWHNRSQKGEKSRMAKVKFVFQRQGGQQEGREGANLDGIARNQPGCQMFALPPHTQRQWGKIKAHTHTAPAAWSEEGKNH